MDRTLDELLDTPWWHEPEDAVLQRLREIETLSRRLYAAAVDGVREVDRRGLVTTTGYPDLPALLRHVLRITRPEARNRMRNGEILERSEPVRVAARTGLIGPEHIEAVGRTLGQIPDHVTLEQRQEAEVTLTEHAQKFDSRALRIIGRHVLDGLDPDGPEPVDPPYREPVNELRYHLARSGRVTFSGQVEPEAGALLAGLLSPLAKPRPIDGHPDLRPAAQRQGDAFAELLQLAAQAGNTPSEGGTRPQVAVTISFDALREGVGRASLGDEAELTAEQARRIACDASIVPMVLGSESATLDVGRSTRTIPVATRRMLVLRDGGCAFPGCDRRPQWTDAHHILHWAKGGPTEPNNLVLLCRRDHSLIHHGGWEVRIRGGLPEFIPPPFVDPEQRPRRNTLHRPPPGLPRVPA